MNLSVERLALLRAALRENSIDTCIIPSSDPHLGEYVPDHWRIIQWLTGFTGSAATVVVTDTFAGLWTDSRYFIQAEKQLYGSGFEFVKPSASKGNDYPDFISANSLTGQKVGIDGRVFSLSRFRRIEKGLKKQGPVFVTDCDLVTELWTDRPAMPCSVAFDHPARYCGKERLIKINEVREEMIRKSVDYHFLASADDIMWLLNIRGSDLKYSPLLLSYALIGMDQVLLFAGESKIPPRLAKEFDNSGIVILPYEDTFEIIAAVTDGASVLI
ncbi:MAG: aminopeptidase P family N-terminal domain-containing protein, partial [Bacteroidales bacterium]